MHTAPLLNSNKPQVFSFHALLCILMSCSPMFCSYMLCPILLDTQCFVKIPDYVMQCSLFDSNVMYNYVTCLGHVIQFLHDMACYVHNCVMLCNHYITDYFAYDPSFKWIKCCVVDYVMSCQVIITSFYVVFKQASLIKLHVNMIYISVTNINYKIK